VYIKLDNCHRLHHGRNLLPGASRSRRIDGEGALCVALSEGFAVLIPHRMLPGRDGLEVLATLKLVKPAPRVIMLTARAGSTIGSRVSMAVRSTT